MVTTVASGADQGANSADRQRDRLVLAAALLSALLAVAWLSWLLLTYVPSHAHVFEVFGVRLTRPAIVAFQASNTFLRYLPYLVLLLTLSALAGGTGKVARAIRDPTRATMRAVLTAAIVVGVTSALASAFLVWGIHTAYARAAADGLWKEAERRLEVYRAEHPSKQP